MYRLLKALRRFLKSVPARASGSFMPSPSDNVVRLRFDAPTVSKAETEKLGPKWIEDNDDYRPIG